MPVCHVRGTPNAGYLESPWRQRGPVETNKRGALLRYRHAINLGPWLARTHPDPKQKFGEKPTRSQCRGCDMLLRRAEIDINEQTRWLRLVRRFLPNSAVQIENIDAQPIRTCRCYQIQPRS